MSAPRPPPGTGSWPPAPSPGPPWHPRRPRRAAPGPRSRLPRSPVRAACAAPGRCRAGSPPCSARRHSPGSCCSPRPSCWSRSPEPPPWKPPAICTPCSTTPAPPPPLDPAAQRRPYSDRPAEVCWCLGPRNRSPRRAGRSRWSGGAVDQDRWRLSSAIIARFASRAGGGFLLAFLGAAPEVEDFLAEGRELVFSAAGQEHRRSTHHSQCYGPFPQGGGPQAGDGRRPCRLRGSIRRVRDRRRPAPARSGAVRPGHRRGGLPRPPASAP